MANTLILNQPQVFNGLGTLTYTVPTGTATQLYSANVQAMFPFSQALNSFADTTIGIGYGGVGPVGAGSGMGLGSGPGGGGQGFVLGDRGTGSGGVGQGFGTANNYPQPSSNGNNAVAQSPALSSLSIIVAKNGVTIYTSTVPRGTQSALQFITTFSAAAGDAITVVSSSSASVDNQLSGITITAAIQQGF